MSRVFLGLGSNEGDRLGLISRAARLLGERPGIRLIRMAPIIESDPAGGPPQGPYLNTALEIETTLTPQALLAEAKAVEAALGRLPSGVRWGPRPIDVDILLYGDTVLHTDALSIPHLMMHHRPFVLEPLAQLEPDLVHPVLKQTMSSLRDAALAKQQA